MQGHESPGTGLNWDDVRLFLAVARARTLSDAASNLGVDASTVSRRLGNLEQALRAALFERSRDGVSSTKAAEDLLPIAEEIEGGMLRFANAADGLEREVSGQVRITCPPDVADVLLTPLLPELLATHPGLRVVLDAGEALLDLSRREADVALRTVRPERGDLLVTRLTSAGWVLAAAPILAQELGTLRSWQAAPWVGWGERRSNLPAARWLASHAPNVEPLVRSDSLLVQLAVVGQGLGVALVPEPSVTRYGLAHVACGKSLRADMAAWPRDELFLVSHSALRRVPRVRAVWEFLCQRLGGR